MVAHGSVVVRRCLLSAFVVSYALVEEKSHRSVLMKSRSPRKQASCSDHVALKPCLQPILKSPDVLRNFGSKCQALIDVFWFFGFFP